jgi:hypothetical protein
LLTDFGADVAIVWMEFREFGGVGVDVGESEFGFAQGLDYLEYGGLESGEELVNTDCGIAQDAAEGAEGNFLVKGNGNRKALRVGSMPKADMAALLADGYITKLSKGANEVCARDHGQLRAHRVTTTLPIRTFSVSGSSSPRLSMSSRHRSMASRILARASETVLPWE